MQFAGSGETVILNITIKTALAVWFMGRPSENPFQTAFVVVFCYVVVFNQ